MDRKCLRVFFCTSALVLLLTEIAGAHHILGRPASSLNEDSNTPPSIQEEIRIGEYLVNYMVYPAFPKPGEPGQINVTAERVAEGTSFDGKITFKILDNTWYSNLGFDAADPTTLGVQVPDDHVFRQRVVFPADGDYLISARFRDKGEHYVIDFPIRIGEPSPFGPIGAAIGGLMLVLVSVSLIQRRRLITGKVRNARNKGAAPGTGTGTA